MTERFTKHNKIKKNIIVIKFNNYAIIVMMIFCGLYPFLLAMTRLTRVDTGKPSYLMPIFLFLCARILTYLDDNDINDKYTIKVGKIKLPIKYVSIPIPFIFMLINFNSYMLKSPWIFIVDLMLFSLFYFISLISKKTAIKMLKIGNFFVGLIIACIGFYLSFLMSSDFAIAISFACIFIYCIGLLMISVGQISINTSAIKEMVEKFLNFIKHILRTITTIVSPKKNFIRIMNIITKKNQQKNLAYDDILEDVGENHKIEYLDDEHPKYYFKNIKKIINLIFKIRYCYAYVLYNMNDSGIETDKSETVTQLKERIVNEYDETEEGNQLGSIFCNLTDTYEIARYAERLPDPANYENIENDVKNTVRLCKSILRNKGKKLKK